MAGLKEWVLSVSLNTLSIQFFSRQVHFGEARVWGNLEDLGWLSIGGLRRKLRKY